MASDPNRESGIYIPEMEVISFKTEKGMVMGLPLWAGDSVEVLPDYFIASRFLNPFGVAKQMRFVCIEDVTKQPKIIL